MKKNICLLQLLLMCWTLSWSQESKKQLSNTNKPDLSGTWVLDSEEGGSARTNSRSPEEFRLVVVHHEPEIKITRISNSEGRRVARESTYYSDARGEKNLRPKFIISKPSNAVDEVMKSKTKWSGNTLVTQTNIHKVGTLSLIIFDEWRLSDDGKILTQTATYRFIKGIEFGPHGDIIPSGPRVFKYIFRREP